MAHGAKQNAGKSKVHLKYKEQQKTVPIKLT